MPCAQPGAADGCWPSSERRWAVRSAGKREIERKRRTTGAEFENRVNGASEGGTLLLSAHVRSKEQESLLQPRLLVAHASIRVCNDRSCSAASTDKRSIEFLAIGEPRKACRFHKNATNPSFQSWTEILWKWIRISIASSGRIKFPWKNKIQLS